jgi:hypothetical protein
MGPCVPRGRGRSCRLPGEERRRFVEEVTLGQEPLVLGPEAAVLLVEGGELAVAWEGMWALVREGLPAVAEEVLTEAEGAGSLGDGRALLGDELDSLRLELGGVGASRSRH